MLTSNKNRCFSYNKTFYTKLWLQNKQHTCKRRPYYNTVNYLNCIKNRTKRIIKWKINKFHTRNCFSFLHAISHYILKKCNKLFKTQIDFTNIFLGSSYDWPGTVVRELGQTINKYAIKKIDKIKYLYRILVSGKFSTNVYVKSTC